MKFGDKNSCASALLGLLAIGEYHTNWRLSAMAPLDLRRSALFQDEQLKRHKINYGGTTCTTYCGTG